MNDKRNSGYAFIALAFAFFGMGLTTQPVFIAIATAFLAVGASFLAQSKVDSTEQKKQTP